MKRLIDNTKIVNQTANLTEVNDEKYYGVTPTVDCSNGFGFISREQCGTGKFTAICTDGVTDGNRWSAYDNDNLKEMLKEMISANWLIFEFDNPKDLFTWLGRHTPERE